jgi:hypothetical protein
MGVENGFRTNFCCLSQAVEKALGRKQLAGTALADEQAGSAKNGEWRLR